MSLTSILWTDPLVLMKSLMVLAAVAGTPAPLWLTDMAVPVATGSDEMPAMFDGALMERMRLQLVRQLVVWVTVQLLM